MKEYNKRHFQMKLPSLITVIAIVAVALIIPWLFGDDDGGAFVDVSDIINGTGSSESTSDQSSDDAPSDAPSDGIAEDGEYLDLDSVAAYIHQFGKLPKNYLTKSEAKARGWESSEGNLWVVASGCAIGGDIFRNYEGQLPAKSGRVYYECDVNYEGGYRGAERIVFSNDGLIFYTSDHYATFTELYAEDEK